MKEPWGATADELRGILAHCPVCGQSVAGHAFSLLGLTVATPENLVRVETLITNIREHDWESVRKYAEFEGAKDAVAAYVILGSHPCGVCILVKDPFELYAGKEIYLQETLSPDEVNLVKDICQEWHRF